jgi:hypothetical protein
LNGFIVSHICIVARTSKQVKSFFTFLLAYAYKQAYTIAMNRTSTEKRAQIIACLAEGNSIRATSRLTGAAKNTIVKLLCDAGRACSAYQDKVFRNLKCKRIQCDEIWSFVYAKDKNLPEEMRGKNGVGSVWTWTALCPDTKLIPCWFHQSLRVTPAMEAGITDHVWELEEIVKLMEPNA